MRTLNRLTLGKEIGSRSARDLLIDGRSLKEHLERALGRTFAVVSPLGRATLEYERSYLFRLLLLEEPELPSGRRELLVCPLCADLGCGCVAAFVEIREGQVLWHDFAWESPYDPSVLTCYPHVAFLFDLGQYEAALRGYPEKYPEPEERVKATRDQPPGGSLRK